MITLQYTTLQYKYNMSLPVLYNINKNGREQMWRVWTEDDVLCREYGLVDGKHVTVRKKVTGKNIGRSNATTGIVQAQLEAEREWTSQLDKGYKPKDDADMKLYNKVLSDKSKAGGTNKNIVLSSASVQRNFKVVTQDIGLPNIKLMLAHPFEKRIERDNIENNITQWVMQPKLDGVRAVARLHNGKVVLTSRNNNQFRYLDHIRDALLPILTEYNVVFDGELYTHEIIDDGVKVPRDDMFNNYIAKICRVDTINPHPLEQQMCYYIFDIIDTTKPQMERFKLLNTIFSKHNDLFSKHNQKSIVYLTYQEPRQLVDVYKYLLETINEGYEGIMLRHRDALYKGTRVNTLLKLKQFDDDEFTIIGYKEGQCTEKGCVVWRCVTDGGKEFDVRPEGTHELRKELYKNASKYINSKITVKYQGLTATGVPRFPVATVIRDYE